MNLSFALHPQAWADLEDRRNSVALRNPDAADLFIKSVFHTIRTVIVQFPYTGHSRPDLTSKPMLFLVVSNRYLIAYAPHKRPLWILAVFDGRSNPRAMASLLRERE